MDWTKADVVTFRRYGLAGVGLVLAVVGAWKAAGARSSNHAGLLEALYVLALSGVCLAVAVFLPRLAPRPK